MSSSAKSRTSRGRNQPAKPGPAPLQPSRDPAGFDYWFSCGRRNRNGAIGERKNAALRTVGDAQVGRACQRHSTARCEDQRRRGLCHSAASEPAETQDHERYRRRYCSELCRKTELVVIGKREGAVPRNGILAGDPSKNAGPGRWHLRRSGFLFFRNDIVFRFFKLGYLIPAIKNFNWTFLVNT